MLPVDEIKMHIATDRMYPAAETTIHPRSTLLLLFT